MLETRHNAPTATPVPTEATVTRAGGPCRDTSQASFMFPTLIPRDNYPLAVRVKRQLMGFMSYLMFLLPLAYAVENGWLRFGYQGLAVFSAIAIALNVGFLALLRSGWTARFSDPSMMVWQVSVAGLMALVVGWFVDGATVIVLMLFFTAYFFGVFSFSAREYFALSAAGVIGFVLLLVAKYAPDERATNAFRLEVLHVIILAIVLAWMSLLGSYIARLRSQLAQRKDALANALSRLKELASRDELTGLHNRRHLMETLEAQHERSARHGEPFSLCILDLDHFKAINDTHGHAVGDEVLRGFSERIRAHLRRLDVVGRADDDSTFGRYGGEEFLLLLPYADARAACQCILRLRAAMHVDPFQTSAGALVLTFSAGVAEHRTGEGSANLISRADAALYVAKDGGRDRVQLAE